MYPKENIGIKFYCLLQQEQKGYLLKQRRMRSQKLETDPSQTATNMNTNHGPFSNKKSSLHNLLLLL